MGRVTGTPIFLPDANGRWAPVVPKTWNATAAAWTDDPLPPDPGVFKGSLFKPYIAQGTVLTRDVSAMPLDPQSSTLAAWMDANTPYSPGGGFGAKTSLNTSEYGTQPIEVYVVDSRARGCEFQYIDSIGGGSPFLTGPIPWPTWAVPASGGDQSMAIYDLGTGIMREFFFVEPVSGSPGHWTAGAGGWSLANPELRDLATTNYAMQLREGSSAAVAMHNPLGFIGIAEVLSGSIGHAICFTTSQMQTGQSWPAKQGDGSYTGTDAPVEGQWCRLPSSVDPSGYNPLTGLIIRAFQTYGAVATDKNLFVHAFNAEGGRTYKHFYGTDPWHKDGTDTSGDSDGVCVQALTALGGDRSLSLDVSDFPWDLTEWAPVDWERPNPDFGLRSTEFNPYRI